jgi:hypothetical protein
MKIIPLRKPRPTPGKLFNLTSEQRDKLINWMMSGLTYADLIERVRKEFGVSFKTQRPFEHFWIKVCRPILLQRQAEEICAAAAVSNTARKEIKKLLENPEAKVDELKEVLRQIVANDEKPESKSAQPAPAKEKATDEANPLDDQDKLDEIRRQVFGSAPQS